MILGILTFIFVLIHVLAVWGVHKLVTQRRRLKREDYIGLCIIAASALLHITNYIL